jgi:hypothetical protein
VIQKKKQKESKHFNTKKINKTQRKTGKEEKIDKELQD